MVIPSDCIEETRTNLKAPVIINADERLAKQVIYEDPKYPLRYYILKEKNKDVSKGDRLEGHEKAYVGDSSYAHSATLMRHGKFSEKWP